MPQRKRKFNMPLAKSVIMFMLGGFVGLVGAVSGIGMQVTAAPVLAFMLGYSPEKSMGTAAAFGLLAAAGAVIGGELAGSAPSIWIALILAVSATVGAILGVRFAVNPRLKTVQLIAGSLTMAILVYMIAGALRSRTFINEPAFPFFATVAGFVVIGLASGLLSGTLQIASGVLFVPALHYLSGFSPAASVFTSLLVIAFASILPAAVAGGQGRIEGGAGRSTVLGGAVGGVLGGYLLTRLVHLYSPAIPLLTFGLVAMFVGGWQASRRA